MAKLSDYKALAFDVYGTLIDWESGMLKALQPLLSRLSTEKTKQELFSIMHELEKTQQALTPSMPYRDLLATIHPHLAARLGLPAPSEEESRAFGASVGSWPAFPDTVEALKVLSKHYKLVVISNTDKQSFAGTQSGPLQGTPFDLVLLAEDMGCYKPDPKAFEQLEARVEKELGIPKSQILQTAQSQFHDHHPAKKAGIKSCWIVRPAGVMGNQKEEIYDWKFDTLGEMAAAVDQEA